jgi:hypothetical protein
MNIAELKKEVIRQFASKLEAIGDEKILKIILDFLIGIEASDKNGINLSRHCDHIKAKYGSVLKKLA